MLTDIGRFLFDSKSNLPLLGTLLSKTSGLTIVTHAIESPTLPTWHGLPTINTPAKEEDIKFEPQSDAAYATAIKFINGAPSYTKTLKYSSEDVEERLYLVEDEKFTPNTNPLTYLTFSEKNYQATPVLWFQPYDKSSKSIELSIPLGYRIVNSEIDGITIPVPNPSHDTTLNNSFYRQGSIPIGKINPYVPTTNDCDILNVCSRTRHTLQSHPLGYSVRDMSIMALPVLGNENISANINLQDHTSGLTPEPNHACPTTSGTVVAWRSTADPPIPDKSVYFWSSYRTLDSDPYESTQKISMYATLRGLYGTCVTLTRGVHPTKLLPA